ncbi:hypothetical protein NBRC10512_005644 [Rhodotorula toruloides]|uniref:Protein kinase-like domain containing protein n=1 Tax=Rhodotorula toruloides (strain NP11) TaxID=1130832 RepID=M7XNP8_RHOT1|nr:protein kinase-like domain containing protein [Rhodotorula toruloides NP11]EMS25544.1 protein kinase-like domain containing protein [Rhodotorula toruloides NP11]
MHWLPFLRSLCPPTRPASSPVPPQTPAAPSDSSHVALAADFTPTSIVYDPDLAHWIQEQFLRNVEAALAARGWTSEVPEDVIAGGNVALPHFCGPYNKTGVRTICTRFAALGTHFASLIAALDEVLGIQRKGSVEVVFDTVLTTKMRNVDGLPPDFHQRFELVVGTTTSGQVEIAVELTVSLQPGSASEPAQRDGGGGGLFTRTASMLARSQVLSAERLAKDDPLLYEFLAKMIHGAQFYRIRFFLYFNGLTFGVGAITFAANPVTPPTTAPQHGQTPAFSRSPRSAQPFSILITPPIPNGEPTRSHLPTDPPPPSLILIVLAALYPQFVDQESLNARIRQIIDTVGTCDAGEPSSFVKRDRTASPSSTTSPSQATYPQTSPSSTNSPQPPASVSLVWPDRMSASLKPVNPLDLQLRLDALQQKTPEQILAADSTARPRRPAMWSGTIQLERLVHASERSFVYRGTLDGQTIVAKVGRRDWEDAIVDEAAASILAYQRKAAVPRMLALFEGRDRMDDRRLVVAVFPDCGDAPRRWKDLTIQQRINLLLDLVHLHQHAHLEHGDAAPRNTVIDANGTTRWIDLSGARAHDSCGGADCEELNEVCGEMELWDEEAAVREAASKRGLRW